jgi:hypothetical protein
VGGRSWGVVSSAIAVVSRLKATPPGNELYCIEKDDCDKFLLSCLDDAVKKNGGCRLSSQSASEVGGCEAALSELW